jgi:hypothetical protein
MEHTGDLQLSTIGLSDLWINCSAFSYDSSLNIREMTIFLMPISNFQLKVL